MQLQRSLRGQLQLQRSLRGQLQLQRTDETLVWQEALDRQHVDRAALNPSYAGYCRGGRFSSKGWLTPSRPASPTMASKVLLAPR